MANGNAQQIQPNDPEQDQQQPNNDRLKTLHRNLQASGISDVPDFEKFQKDMQSPAARKGVYDLIKNSNVKDVPDFEKFQKDVFGDVKQAPNVASNSRAESGQGEGETYRMSPSFQTRYDRRAEQRKQKWRERAEKLNREAQELESEARTNMKRIPGARSIPDPEKRKQAFAKKQERNRLLSLANETDEVRKEHRLKKLDTGQGRLSSATSSFVRGLGETLGEGTLKSAGIAQKAFEAADLFKPSGMNIFNPQAFQNFGENLSEDAPQDSKLYEYGQEVGDAVREMFPNNPRYQEEFLTSVLPQGAGSMAAFLAGGAVSKTLKLGALGAGALGSATIASDEFDRALEHTDGDTEKAFQQWLVNLPVGATEMVPIGRFLKRLDKTTGGGIKRVLSDGFRGGVEELTQEVTQETLSNATGQALIDETRQLLEGVRDAGAAGFVLGAVMNGAGRAISNARRKASTDEEKRAADRAAEILEAARQDMENVEIRDQRGAAMQSAREDIESVKFTEVGGGEGQTIRAEARVEFDPEASPEEQINQLEAERDRIQAEKRKAEEAGEDVSDFEDVLGRVDESLELLREGAQQPGQQTESEGAPQAESEGLTQEAQDFLTATETAGATPAFVNNTMRRIAEDNGIEVTEETTPEDIVDQLRERRQPVEGQPQEQQESGQQQESGEQQGQDTAEQQEGDQAANTKEQIGQEIEGDIQGEYSNEGLSMAARLSDGTVVVGPRDEIATHAQLLDENDLDIESSEMGFVSPQGKFLNRNEGLQWQQAEQPGFESTAPGVIFAEEINPQSQEGEFVTSDEQFRVQPTEEGVQVFDNESDEQIEPGNEQYDRAVGEFIAAETADAGMVQREEGQSDVEFLRNVAENSSNPVQVASALNQAQEMQEGDTDSELQNSIRERFEELTGTELSPQMAEEIASSKTEQEQSPTAQQQEELAAMRPENQRATVGQILGDATGRDVSPEMALSAIDGGKFFGDEMALRTLRNDNGPMSRSTLVYMSPQQFLDMAAPPNGWNQESLDYQKQRIEEGKKLDGLPMLRIGAPEGKPGLKEEGSDGEVQVQGHEGRHRAKALLDAGVEMMPVMLTHRSLRWGSTQGIRPETIRGQESNVPGVEGHQDNTMEAPQSVFYPQDVDQRNAQSTGDSALEAVMSRGEMGGGTTPATGGVPMTGAEQRFEQIDEDWTQDPVALRDIIDDLVNSVGLNLRQGRITLKNALGQFSRRSGVTRVQVSEALEVIAHEAGHDIDQQFGQELRAIWKLHKDELAPLAYPGVPPKKQLVEGFAEFFRLYITNPAYAEAAAPNFHADFESWMKDLDNNMYSDFQRIRAAYRAFLLQPSDAAVEGDIVQSKTKTEELYETITEEGPWSIIKNKLGKFYRGAIGEDDILRIARDQLLDIHYENTGQTLDISPLMDFYKLNRISLDAYSAGAMDIEYGVENYHSAEAEGPSLRDALVTALGKNWSDKKRRRFSSYLVSKRAVHEYQRFEEGKIPNRPTKLTKKDHELNIKSQEAQNPEFREAAEMVNEYTKNLWKKLRDSGLISDEAYQNGRKEHPFYVPFFRDMSDRSKIAQGDSRGGDGKYSVIDRMEGSDRPILDPIEQIMKQTYEFNMLIKNNDVKKALLKMAHTAGAGSGRIAEEIPASKVQAIPVDSEQVIQQLSEVTDWESYGLRDAMSKLLQLTSLDNVDLPDLTIFKQGEINEKGEPIVFAWDGGQRRAIRLADGEFGMEMYNVLTSQGKSQRDAIVNALAYPASWLRTGVTTEPSFFIANLIRDQVSAWMLTDVGFTPFSSVAQDLSQRAVENANNVLQNFDLQIAQSEAFNEETQREYSRLYRTHSGISTFNTAALDENRAKQEVKKLKQKNIPIRRLKSVRGLNELLDLSEIGTRLGVFQRAHRRARERGLSKKEAAIEAGYMARDLIDFGRNGSKLAFTRRILPFFNAALQGVDKGTRVLSGEGNLWRALKPYIKDVNGRPLNQEEQGKVDLARKAWLKTLEIGMIGASLTMMYKDDPEYDEIPDYLKNTHWMFRNPVYDGDSGEMSTWVAIPKPFELAFLSNTMEHAIMSYTNEDNEFGEQWMKSMWEIIAPPVSPIGIQVPGEVWANKRKFDGRPIVYDRLLGLEPHRQYTSYTSEFGKWMGKQIDVSPMIIDHVIQGTFGSWGRTLLSATSTSEPGAPAEGIEDSWVARRFFRSADRGNKSSRRFWEQMDRESGEMVSANKTFRDFFKRGTPEEAFDYYQKLPKHEKMFVAMEYVKKDNEDVLPLVAQDHPLRNAEKASSLLSGLRGDIVESREAFENVSSDKKRRMDDVVDRLATVYYRNSMIASQHPNYKNREFMDINEPMDIIRSELPVLHRELIRRYNEANMPLNPMNEYRRFMQYATSEGLSQRLESVVQYQHGQIEQQRQRK